MSLLLLGTACDTGEPEARGVGPTPTPDYDYRARLSRLPVDFATRDAMSGTGHVTARLTDGALVIDGSFTGLESPALEAHLHRARPGLRGPVVAILQVSAGPGASDGTLGGSIELTEELRQAVEGNELYVQLHSEDNPGGVLRGWLFPPV